MDPVLALAVLVLVPSLQMPGVLLLSRVVNADAEADWQPGYVDRDRPTEPDPTVGTRCRACETINATEFDFCRRCAARLS